VNAFVSAIGADGIRDAMVAAAPVLMEYPALAEDLAEDDEEVDTPEVAPAEVVMDLAEERVRSDGGLDHRGL
jgi:hypothetical protein